ncbi:MAG: hypothetical protein KME12_23825 [Trichocoleus desertorum ATA4-8-CV12]|jgi:hypothetical protein|nr:hypothetical protein [Trichocoleus desertorum ATA4-8-CV12]
MKTDYTLFFKWASKLFRFFLWLCYGLAIALLLSALFGGFNLVAGLLPAIAQTLLRLAALVFFFLATAIIVESLR